MMDLQENLQQVEANICKACENAGRKRSDVTLIAVSKTKPIEMLQTVYDLGPRDFGENKVQEMCEKMEVLPKDIRWHMIGHLQTNKVKYIIGKTELIHSVDSLHLAKEIEKQAAKQNVTVSILVEVNIAEEESKFGIHKETVSLCRQIAACVRCGSPMPAGRPRMAVSRRAAALSPLAGSERWLSWVRRGRPAPAKPSVLVASVHLCRKGGGVVQRKGRIVRPAHPAMWVGDINACPLQCSKHDAAARRPKRPPGPEKCPPPGRPESRGTWRRR